MDGYWIFGIGFWILCGIGASLIAESKNIDSCLWFFLGVLFGPLAIIIVGFMAPNKEEPSLENHQKCPYCAEIIKREAIVCKHCGRDLPKITHQPKTREADQWESINLKPNNTENLDEKRVKDLHEGSIAFMSDEELISMINNQNWEPEAIEAARREIGKRKQSAIDLLDKTIQILDD